GERAHVRHVAVEQEGDPELLGKRAHALLHRLALIGESEFGAVRGQLLRNPPGERAVVGEAHDQAPLSCHQAGHSFSSSVPLTAFSTANCSATCAASSCTAASTSSRVGCGVSAS